MRANPAKLKEAVIRLTAGESRDAVRRDVYSSHFRETISAPPVNARMIPLKTCIHLGDELPSNAALERGLNPLRHWLYCEHPAKPLGPVVCQCQGCGPPCPGYTAESDDYPKQPGTIIAGVVVGCYGWPRLAEAQIRTIRATCGDGTPILIADDGSQSTGEIALVAERYGVEFAGTLNRLGHYSGDLSVFRKGIDWGVRLGLDVVVKLSMRMIITRPNWLADVAALARGAETVLGFLSEGSEKSLYFRTEAVAMRVPDWARILPRLSDDHLSNPTELRIHDIIQRDFAGRCLHWPLFPRDRYARGHGFIWHCSHTPAEYAAWLQGLGIALDDDFHTDGHQYRPNWKAG